MGDWLKILEDPLGQPRGGLQEEDGSFAAVASLGHAQHLGVITA